MDQIGIDNIIIQHVDAVQVRPMRQCVLRPRQAIEHMVYPGDEAAETFHLAAMNPAGQVIGIASYYLEPHPHNGRADDWRLRGMAVDEARRGLGLGRHLIEAGLDHIREQGGKRLWCNARVTAQPFYEKLGFIAEGNAFDIPTIGPHFVMAVDLE